MMPRLLTLALVVASTAGCTTTSVIGMLEQPAERALLAGMRAYEEGQYAASERELGAALAAGLKHSRDRAAAHKWLAFIQCSTDRMALCEQSFKAAKQADPTLVLSKAEAGNPLWGPVFKRVEATPAP